MSPMRRPKATVRADAPISQFVLDYFCHYNARETRDAGLAYKQFIEAGNGMMITLAGAMSTGQLGKLLAEMIRQDKVHAISCTGANLEESVFDLIGSRDYKPMPDYRDMTAADDQALRDKGMSRVTDIAITDDNVMLPLSKLLIPLWQEAETWRRPRFPHEFLYDILLSGDLEDSYQIDPKDCWMLAAAEKNLPIVTPGWGDSTLGNAFAAACIRGEIGDTTAVRGDIDMLMFLADWYPTFTTDRQIGFFQIGGGIAGDFPICVVPVLTDELKQDVPLWGYFCQITDAEVSYGGYSGAAPREKITWGKLGEKNPAFDIKSDATIVAPLIFAMVLGL